MPSVDTLDTLVYGFIYSASGFFAALFIGGAWWLQRTRPGKHRGIYQAVDIGHQPAHAKPARPPWWTRLGAALADGWREAAEAQALLRGVTL